MSEKHDGADERVCPLCGESNACGNLTAEKMPSACWCMQADLKIPPELLERVPENKRNRACICQACVLKFGKPL